MIGAAVAGLFAILGADAAARRSGDDLDNKLSRGDLRPNIRLPIGGSSMWGRDRSVGAVMPRLAIIRSTGRTSWLNTPAGQGRDRVWAADRDHINTLARVMPDFKTSLTMILVAKAN